MLRFWFHRNSPFPRILEITGLLLSYHILHRELLNPDTATGFFVGFLLLCLFVCSCDWWPWYPKPDRHLGIAVHFRKARIPTSYVLILTSLGYFFGLRYVLVIPALLCILVVVSVNGILIYFHCHDKDPLPVNYFSANKYLKSPHPPFAKGGK